MSRDNEYQSTEVYVSTQYSNMSPDSSTNGDRGDLSGDSGSLHSHLLALLQRQRLTPVQRRVAHYMLDHSDEIVFLGASELADLSGVSQASVSRFAQTLGFEGYPDLLSYIRRVRLSVDGGIAESPTKSRNRFQEALADEISNLSFLEELFERGHLFDRLGADLSASQPLVVLGVRASAAVAEYFAYFAEKVHPDVRRITGAGTRAVDLLTQARDAGAKWLLAFVFPRVPREVLSILEYAHSIGFLIACVTPDRLGPIAERADSVIDAPVGTRLIFDSQAAPLLVAAALVDAIAEADPERTRSRLESFERVASTRRFFAP